MLRLHSPHKPCHHLQAQDCCNFCSESHRHMLLSTRRTWTIRRPLQTRTRTRELNGMLASFQLCQFDMPCAKDNTNTLVHMHTNKPHLDKLACCMHELRRLHKSCRHSQARGYCKFSSEFRRHNLLSTPRNGTIHRRVYCL